MRILVDINHPGHVHFFRFIIYKRILKGDDILVCASEKDVATDLLKEFGLPFVFVGSYGKSLVSKVLSIPLMAYRIYREAKKFRPDLMMGIGSSRITHAGALLGIKSWVFTDTEHATEQILLYRPFASKIITPSSFKLNFGKKHLRYNGCHELSYLHPRVFNRSEKELSALGLNAEKPYFILRFVAWDASHDVGQKGLSLSTKKELISLLSGYGQVIISAESELPKEFEQYRFHLPSSKMHLALAHCRLYVGEGGTMANEAAILGAPSILVSSLSAGVFDELQNRGLLVHLRDDGKLLETIKTLLKPSNTLEIWRAKKEKLLSESVDVSNWIDELIDKEFKTKP